MPSNKLEDAEPVLQRLYPLLKLEYQDRMIGYDLRLTTTHRTPEEQYKLFKQGRTLDVNGKVLSVDKASVVTYIDGINLLGPHNFYPSRAIDVAVIEKGRSGLFLWSPTLYEEIIEILENLSAKIKVEFTSGGSWKNFKDWPHIQIANYRSYKPDHE